MYVSSHMEWVIKRTNYDDDYRSLYVTHPRLVCMCLTKNLDVNLTKFNSIQRLFSYNKFIYDFSKNCGWLIYKFESVMKRLIRAFNRLAIPQQ